MHFWWWWWLLIHLWYEGRLWIHWWRGRRRTRSKVWHRRWCLECGRCWWGLEHLRTDNHCERRNRGSDWGRRWRWDWRHHRWGISGDLSIARALEAPAGAALALAHCGACERWPESAAHSFSAVVVPVGREPGDLAVPVHQVAARKAAGGYVEQHAVGTVAAATRPTASVAAAAVEHWLAAVELIVLRKSHLCTASVVRQVVGLIVEWLKSVDHKESNYKETPLWRHGCWMSGFSKMNWVNTNYRNLIASISLVLLCWLSTVNYEYSYTSMEIEIIE